MSAGPALMSTQAPFESLFVVRRYRDAASRFSRVTQNAFAPVLKWQCSPKQRCGQFSFSGTGRTVKTLHSSPCEALLITWTQNNIYLDTTEQQEGIKFSYWGRGFTLPPNALTKCVLLMEPTRSNLKTQVGYLVTQQLIRLKDRACSF